MSSTYVDGTTPLDAAHMNALQQKVEKGIANGYPSLDGTGKIPSAQLPPISSVDYAGAYNASTTYHAGEYVVGSDGITYQCVKDGTVGISPTPWAPAPSIPYGTSLPSAPVDGQEAVLVDVVTNPSWIWRFRYNAGSTSPYKWECIGGASYIVTVYGAVNGAQTLPANTWSDLPGATTITFPTNGVYDVVFTALAQNWSVVSPAYQYQFAFDINGSKSIAAYFVLPDNTKAAGVVTCQQERRTGIVAGNIGKIQVNPSVAISTGYGQATISIQPVRVS